MSKPAAEIKLALTKDGFSDDLRKIIKCLKEKDVNHTTMTNRLWEFCEDFEQLSITPFTLDETKELIPLLLERVQALADRAKQEKEIAGVLAVCVLAAKYDFAVRAPLIDGGLIVPLMKIIKGHRDQENVLEKGLWVANWLIHCNGKERVLSSLLVVNLMASFICPDQLLLRRSSWTWASPPSCRKPYRPITRSVTTSRGRQAVCAQCCL